MSVNVRNCTGTVGQVPTPNLARAREATYPGPSRLPKVETPEFADMLERMLNAYVKRVGDGDPEDLARMMDLQERFHGQVGEAARLIRKQLGYSWGDLAKACDRHRSTLHARFAKAPEEPPSC